MSEDYDFLEKVGLDAQLWAKEFNEIAIKLGYSDMDEGWLIGWFANAIMAGYDIATFRYTGSKPYTIMDDGTAFFIGKV